MTNLVFYRYDLSKIDKKIEDLKSQIAEIYEERKRALSESKIQCFHGGVVHNVSDIEAIDEQAYQDDVYTGHYYTVEYKWRCPNCGKWTREYHEPELKKLRPYYKNVERKEV